MHGECAAQPKGVAREGYTFGTWDEELQEDVYIDEPLYENVTLETVFPGYTYGSWAGVCDTTLYAQWKLPEAKSSYFCPHGRGRSNPSTARLSVFRGSQNVSY